MTESKDRREFLIRAGKKLGTRFVGAELAYESVINYIGAASIRRINVEGRIGARRPDRNCFVPGQEKTFGFKVSALTQGQGCPEGPLVDGISNQARPSGVSSCSTCRMISRRMVWACPILVRTQAEPSCACDRVRVKTIRSPQNFTMRLPGGGS